MTTETTITPKAIGSTLIQIFKVNEPKTGVSKSNGKPYELQDAECALLNEDGSVDQIGVLMLPRELRGSITAGIYTGSFTLRPDLRSRRIEAVLVGLRPVPTRKPAAA